VPTKWQVRLKNENPKASIRVFKKELTASLNARNASSGRYA